MLITVRAQRVQASEPILMYGNWPIESSKSTYQF